MLHTSVENAYCVIDAAIVAATPLIHSFEPNLNIGSKDDQRKSKTHLQAKMDKAFWIEQQAFLGIQAFLVVFRCEASPYTRI